MTDIEDAYVMTPQEHLFMGGTIHEGTNPFRPVGLGQYNLSEIVEARKKLGILRSGLIGLGLGLKKTLVISLSDLDSEGSTLEDPKILGTWDSEKKEIIPYLGRDLTKEFIEGSRSRGLEIPMRDQNPPREISRK